ncbi:MAG: hypothetical protein K2L21_05685 [Muribaculaceae bacterium]|nr:hypothetical protein [Muribaculaceae bacterium]
MIRSSAIRFFSAAVAAAALTGCFTGIESTPRITAGDVRRQAAATPTPEMLFLASVGPQPPAAWTSGKRFRVADSRIERLFAYTDGRADNLEGATLSFEAFEDAPSLTGEGATYVALTTDRADTLRYRIDSPRQNVLERERLEIPFTVEMLPVEQADSLMRSHIYYISTPLWRRTDGRTRPGKRHIPVRILSVQPGTDGIYPAAVIFTPEQAPADTAMVMMSLSGDKAPRSFATIFSFTNPRDRYPRITDDVWELIVNSRVETGMTRDECRLALGSPTRTEQIPTRAGMIERWSYGEGIYLVFEDGMLSSFRL